MQDILHSQIQQTNHLPDLINIDNLVSDMVNKLFYSIFKNKHHVLHQLLHPECSDCGYTLGQRRHELSLR